MGLRAIKEALCNRGGQATVEAAFLIPILFIGLLLLVQPGIFLYDRIVMGAAASETCRLLATKTDAAGDMSQSCEAFVRHRLAAIPQVSCFHVHDNSCSWNIECEGNESTETTRVTIRGEARPLPLLDVSGALLGIVNDAGNFEIEVSVEQPTQPAWVDTTDTGRDPSTWIGAWSK